MDSADHSLPSLVQSSAFREALAAQLNEYKAGLLEEFSDGSAGFLHFVRLAVNEAEGLAWFTPYAHLFLPALVEEKIQYVRRWTRHQHCVSPGLQMSAGEHGGNTP